MSKSYAGLEDLLCDESFLSWYFKTDVQSVQRWEKMIEGDAGVRERVAQAVVFLDTLRLEEEGASPEQVTAAERRLLEAIREAERRKGGKVVEMKRRWWMAAASVLLLAAGAYAGYRQLTNRQALQTAYGEIKGNDLPDGTEIVVNAHSSVRYAAGWKDGKDREVWLTGEAYFHVKKTPLRSRFIVHTDHFDIIVTGTAFNVVSREDKANVMLKEGSVILHTTEGRELKMKPGDFVEYHPQALEKKILKSDSLLAWKEHKLVFSNTPLTEVAKIIQEHYGVTVTLADSSVGRKSVSGIMDNENLDLLLMALRETSDFDVVREGDRVIIRTPQNQDHSKL